MAWTLAHRSVQPGAPTHTPPRLLGLPPLCLQLPCILSINLVACILTSNQGISLNYTYDALPAVPRRVWRCRCRLWRVHPTPGCGGSGRAGEGTGDKCSTVMRTKGPHVIATVSSCHRAWLPLVWRWLYFPCRSCCLQTSWDTFPEDPIPTLGQCGDQGSQSAGS